MEDEALERLFRLYHAPLVRYLTRRLGDRDWAEEVAQETFLRALRQESIASERSWLFAVATNLVRDAARRGKHRESVSLDDQESSTMTPISDAPVPERQAEIRTDLQRAMTKLEPMQRELLWLAYAQGASHEEIAEVLGVRAISVRTLLFRAKKKLASFLTGTAGEVQEAVR